MYNSKPIRSTHRLRKCLCCGLRREKKMPQLLSRRETSFLPSPMYHATDSNSRFYWPQFCSMQQGVKCSENCTFSWFSSSSEGLIFSWCQPLTQNGTNNCSLCKHQSEGNYFWGSFACWHLPFDRLFLVWIGLFLALNNCKNMSLRHISWSIIPAKSEKQAQLSLGIIARCRQSRERSRESSACWWL